MLFDMLFEVFETLFIPDGPSEWTPLISAMGVIFVIIGIAVMVMTTWIIFSWAFSVVVGGFSKWR